MVWVTDREAVYKLFEEEHPDMVVNFAAESHVDRSIENPEVFLNTNIIGTAVLMDACRKYGIKRYHQVSTDEVYGDLPLDRPDLFFTEETPIHTSSPYSSSKASADLLVLAYHRTYGLPVSISRCSNNYGPYHFPEKLIPLMIANALNDKPLPVYGKGENVRDWLYVEDHCRAIDLIIHKGRVGEVYNVGGHNEMRVSIGLRINPEYSTQEGHAIYDPCAPGSRLGMTREAFEKGLAGLGMRRQEDGSYELPEDVEGLHFHTLCEQDADDLECTFLAFEEQFASYLKQVRWLNLGGGHHITRPGYQIERLKKLIGYIRETYGLAVYLEPGEAVALNAGYLVTEVCDIVHNGMDILILDASAACHN